jgi:hypothetical protein
VLTLWSVYQVNYQLLIALVTNVIRLHNKFLVLPFYLLYSLDCSSKNSMGICQNCATGCPLTEIKTFTCGPGGSLTIRDNRMCVPIAKNRPPNADLIRAIGNKTKELSPLMWTGLSDNNSRPDETVVPDSLYSGFAHWNRL